MISFSLAWSASGVADGPCSSGSRSSSLGSRNCMKGLSSATMRSHSSDWLSWMPIDMAALTGSPSYWRLRPCSYSAWPVSWIVPVRPSMTSFALNRVVMRTSVGWLPPVKGCTLTSRRPMFVLKPRSMATSLHRLACASTSHSPCRKLRSGAVPPSFSSLMSGTRPLRTVAKMVSSRAAVMPFSKSSRHTSYAGRVGSMMAHFSRTSSTHSCSTGANLLKSSAWRAAIQAW
mmetsp:Transcript_6496/g.16829  ORF Transcript_6496/g.16829 Transcript_6496/m.16829 type:complete len:231 (+) Transcript_6496:802-1494(+)